MAEGPYGWVDTKKTASLNIQDKSIKYTIPGRNIGFQLLKKAGWKEGEGLGVNKQGRDTPLEPRRRPHLRGLGAACQDHQGGAEHTTTTTTTSGKKEGEEGGQAGSSRKRKSGVKLANRDSHSEEKIDPVEANKRARALSSHVKQKARDRSIQYKLLKEFREPDSSSGDHNPLLRAKKEKKEDDWMSASNPLRLL